MVNVPAVARPGNLTKPKNAYIIYEAANESRDDSLIVGSALRYKRKHFDFV